MKLAISNIAWDAVEDSKVLALMQHYGVAGLEVAPTKIWGDPLAAKDTEIASYRNRWNNEGIEVVAMQSLIYGKPELTIFDSPKQRQATLEYLKRIIGVGGKLGCGALVFGSPKNRQRGEMSESEAMDIAIDFFAELGDTAHNTGTTFCIEPNPPGYDCDFINTIDEGIALVAAVDHPGFRLHIDTGSITMNDEDPVVDIEAAMPWAAHFHISEPFLMLIGTEGADHASLGMALRKNNYNGWVSIEMRPYDNGHVEGVEAAFKIANRQYLEK